LTSYPELHVHPSTAEEQDIKGSNKVAIKTPKGSVQHMIKLTEDIHREVVIRVYG
jgi:anaerobic selenocysteine-containing dehydrogenase